VALVLESRFEQTLAFDLRRSWQARALLAAEGKAGMVLLSMIDHSYGTDTLRVLLPLVFPGYIEPSLPCLASCGKVDKSGAVVADVIMKNHDLVKDKVIYGSELELRDEFRKLADRLKLPDADRIELFKCVQRWVVADRRLDPSFDPQDPDAKRLH
jgi:hypothetical protein